MNEPTERPLMYLTGFSLSCDPQVMAHCVPVPLQMAHPALGPTVEDLDIGYLQAKSVRPCCRFLWPWTGFLLALLIWSHQCLVSHLTCILDLQKGLRVKFLLITNPNNPLGVIYSPDVVKNIVTWARKRGIDTIVDEIFALSTFKVRKYLGLELLNAFLVVERLKKVTRCLLCLSRAEGRTWISICDSRTQQ